MKQTETEETPILPVEEPKKETNKETSEKGQFADLSEMQGFLLGVLSALFEAVCVASVNQMKQEVHHLQLNGYRFLTIFSLTCLYFCWVQKLPRPQLSSKYGYWWFLFCLTCFCYWPVCFYTSAVYISIGIVGSITQIGEILLAAVAICIISRKMIGCMLFLSVFLGTVGILCLHQKFLSFSVENDNLPRVSALGSDENFENSVETHHDLNNMNSFESEQILGVVLAVSAAILDFGAISILNHHLQELSVQVLLFWMSFYGTVSSFLLAWPIEPNWALPDNTRDFGLFLTHCVCFLFACCLSKVPVYCASVLVSTLSYATSLVFLFLIQWFILGDMDGPPGLYVEVFGAVLVVVSSFSVPVCDVVFDKLVQTEKTEKADNCQDKVK